MPGETVRFSCEKQPAIGSRGMVVTNHPMGSSAGAEMLAAGGNAIDAAVASLLALTVVEPMMVGIAGGGLTHLRLADGTHLVVDALACAPKAVHPEIFEPVSDEPPHNMETKGRRSEIGPSSVAVPGNLAGWCSLHDRFGKLPFADVVEPAIRLAARGFTATHYLTGAIGECAKDLAGDPVISSVLMPGGSPIRSGERVFMQDYADSLRLIAKEGAAALHGGALGRAMADRIAQGGDAAGWVTLQDLASYRPVDREVVTGTYRGFDIVGPPPPASSGVHIVQMLNIMEGYDVAGMGYGSVASLDLLARTIALAFDYRRAASGDPDFVDIPVAELTAKASAEKYRAQLGLALPSLPLSYESRDTTHVTVADHDGNIVTATHTINGIFGARFMVPGTGIIPNNYMMNFDPHPGRALSVAPGKRVPTSMAPMMICKGGKPHTALGLPGGLRIFPSAFQTIVNLIDHGMDLQHAVEAPRLWTQGQEVEIEEGYASKAASLAALGHEVKVMPHIGGGMNAIQFGADGFMTGAACWRADGTAMGLGGGLARPGVRFWPDKAPDDPEQGKAD